MPKELKEKIRLVVSSWFCFVRAGFYYATGPFLQFFTWWHPLKKFKPSSQLHKLFISCVFSLKPQPQLETAETETSEGCSRRSCFHSQCDSSDWTSMTTSFPSPHPSFSPRSSSSWEWGDEAIRGRLESVQDREKMVICFTGQLIPHLTEWDWRNIEKERRRWDEAWCH